MLYPFRSYPVFVGYDFGYGNTQINHDKPIVFGLIIADFHMGAYALQFCNYLKHSVL